MFIGIARYELFIPASGSLKDKRRVLRSVTQAVQKRFNVAIAEIDHQDKWQRAALGISCVAGTTAHCRDVLDNVDRAIWRAAVDGAEISSKTVEILAFEDLR